MLKLQVRYLFNQLVINFQIILIKYILDYDLTLIFWKLILKFIVGWKTENEWELTFVSVVHIIIIVKSPILSSTSIWCVLCVNKSQRKLKGKSRMDNGNIRHTRHRTKTKKNTKQHRKLKRWLTQTPTKTAGRTLGKG